MAKRPATEDLDDKRTLKRSKLAKVHLFDLSNELLLRILSQSSVLGLMTCQRVSRKLSIIASDSQLWKAAYYNRFVRPRVYRLPPPLQHPLSMEQFPFSAKLSQWLDEGKLARSGKETNWQRQYKIRHNWAVGSCGLNEIPVASRWSTPPLLARLQDGVVYTVDVASGLRAWDYKEHRKLLASQDLSPSSPLEEEGRGSAPISLALDSTVSEGEQLVAIGHRNGSFSIYRFDRTSNEFSHLYRHASPSPSSSSSSSNREVKAIALLSPFLFTASGSGDLSLYKFPSTSRVPRNNAASKRFLEQPRLLSSLKCDTVSAPVSLSLRRQGAGDALLASIAYSFFDYTSRAWSVGIQELHLQEHGELIQSRLARATRKPYIGGFMDVWRSAQGYLTPTSISYSHPYCLVSHSDNTLTSFLVTSTPASLSISRGERLSGHASGVLGAQVGSRGKAVSIASKGNEVRVWQLEGQGGRSREVGSVRVTPTPEKHLNYHNNTHTATINISSNSQDAETSQVVASRWGRSSVRRRLFDAEEQQMSARSCVGFDDESLVILSGHRHGGQVLMIYDFT